MGRSLRVTLYDEVRSPDEPFRAPFARFPGLEIVGECSTWQELQVFLSAASVDAVIVNLDKSGGKTETTVVPRIAEIAPQCGIIGVSRSSEPNAIIGAIRAGCHQFVRWPVDADDLQAALDRISKVRMPIGTRCRTIGVIAASGGSGATTIACNLATELAQVTGLQCALIDMDLQYGDVACAFDLAPRYSVADVCQSGVDIDRTMLESALTELSSRVSVLAAPEKIDRAEEISSEGVAQMFRVLRQVFPFAVADLPRYFSPPIHATLESMDRVLIVTQLSVPQLRHATRIYESLFRWGANEDQVDIVLNRTNAHFERIKQEEVEEHFHRPVFAIIPNDYKRIGASRDRGHPLMADASNGPARLAIQDLARRLARS